MRDIWERNDSLASRGILVLLAVIFALTAWLCLSAVVRGIWHKTPWAHDPEGPPDSANPTTFRDDVDTE